MEQKLRKRKTIGTFTFYGSFVSMVILVIGLITFGFFDLSKFQGIALTIMALMIPIFLIASYVVLIVLFFLLGVSFSLQISENSAKFSLKYTGVFSFVMAFLITLISHLLFLFLSPADEFIFYLPLTVAAISVVGVLLCRRSLIHKNVWES